jgi:nicotinic acid phosphoribosyltransferase
LAEQARDNPNNIYVVRPDSGDYVQTVLDVCKRNLPNLRFIQGDGMNPGKIKAVVEAIHAAGFKLHEKGIFGVGGWLRNTPTRDLFSSAYKLSAIGDDLEPVCKLSEVRTKMSVPGPTKLIPTSRIVDNVSVVFAREYKEQMGDDRYRVYYDGITKQLGTNNKPYIPMNVRQPNFSKLRDTVYNSFNEAGAVILDRDYGLNDSIFSDEIAGFRNDTFDKYKG